MTNPALLCEIASCNEALVCNDKIGSADCDCLADKPSVYITLV